MILHIACWRWSPVFWTHPHWNTLGLWMWKRFHNHLGSKPNTFLKCDCAELSKIPEFWEQKLGCLGSTSTSESKNNLPIDGSPARDTLDRTSWGSRSGGRCLHVLSNWDPMGVQCFLNFWFRHVKHALNVVLFPYWIHLPPLKDSKCSLPGIPIKKNSSTSSSWQDSSNKPSGVPNISENFQPLPKRAASLSTSCSNWSSNSFGVQQWKHLGDVLKDRTLAILACVSSSFKKQQKKVFMKSTPRIWGLASHLQRPTLS